MVVKEEMVITSKSNLKYLVIIVVFSLKTLVMY